MIRIARPRAGERLTVNGLRGQTEFATGLAHLVLKHVPQRLDEAQVHLFRQSADIVVRF